jgi:galactose-1-phosphate uridylyltransferase
MIDMSNKLKDLECPLLDPYVIHYIMMSLPTIFGNFKINYNSSDKKWTMVELITKLSQEEERLKTENGKNIVNFIKGSIFGHGKSGGKISCQKGKVTKPYEPPKEASKEDVTDEKNGPKCLHCKKYEHIRRECDDFKACLGKKGNDFISFIDESFINFSSNT